MALVALLVAVGDPPPQAGVDLDPGGPHCVYRRGGSLAAFTGKHGNVMDEASSDGVAKRGVLTRVKDERVPSVIDQLGRRQTRLRVERARQQEPERLFNNPVGRLLIEFFILLDTPRETLEQSRDNQLTGLYGAGDGHRSHERYLPGLGGYCLDAGHDTRTRRTFPPRDGAFSGTLKASETSRLVLETSPNVTTH